MIPKLEIRCIEEGDLADVLAIYRPYIENTAITFEYTVPTLEEWRERVLLYTEEYPWLVALWNRQIVGYAYASKHRDRVAYSWDVEVSVYIEENFHGKGLARNLYLNLFEILKYQGFVNAYAIITSPNPKSEKFHEKFGFTDVGYFFKSGYKFNEWFNTRWMQYHLSDHSIPPKQIIPFRELKKSGIWKDLICFPM